MTFDVEKVESRKLANWVLNRHYGDPDDNEAVLARQLLRADEEIEFLRKNRDDVERVKEQREAYANKLEAELLAARAVVDAARPVIHTASEWKQDKFYVSLGALSEAIGAYDKATKAEDGGRG